MAKIPGINLKRPILTSKAVKPTHNSSAGPRFSGHSRFYGYSWHYRSQAQRICISEKIDDVVWHPAAEISGVSQPWPTCKKVHARMQGLEPWVAGTAPRTLSKASGTQWAHLYMMGIGCMGTSTQILRVSFHLSTIAFLNHSPDWVKEMGTCTDALTDCFWYICKYAFVLEKCLVYIINSTPLMKHFLKISPCTDVLL